MDQLNAFFEASPDINKAAAKELERIYWGMYLFSVICINKY
jgi:hypothetical protein